MNKNFSYNPDTPCLILSSGQEIGALIAGVLYRFNSGRHHTETFIVIDGVVFEYGEQIGHIEGDSIVMEKRYEILEIVEAA